MTKPLDVYRELQRRIDALPIAYPETESGVELRLLRHLFDDNEAAVACELSALAEPTEKICRRLAKRGIHYSENELTTLLNALVERGAITSGAVKIGKARAIGYSLLPLAVGMFEMQVDRLTPEYTRDFEEYLHKDFGPAVFATKTGQLRIVPVGKSVGTEREIGVYDDIVRYVREVKGPFAVMNCVCRQGKDLLEDPCDHGDIRETCLTIGGAAAGMSRRGNARRVSREEFLGILDRAEKRGFVIQPENTREPSYICCCCGDCCEILSTAKLLPHPVEAFHTNHFVELNKELCTECGRCVKRCQMDALDPPNVALDKCIGCGLCVSTCPTDSLKLVPKRKSYSPPKNGRMKFLRMYFERRGLARMPILLSRILLKKKI